MKAERFEFVSLKSTFSVIATSIILTIFFAAGCGQKELKGSFEIPDGSLAQTESITDTENPNGNCDRLLDNLRLELAYQLAIAGKTTQERLSSKAPTDDAGLVTDLTYNSVTETLTWSYVNQGDYDCDGEVGVPDITPIAQNYLASTSDSQGDDEYEAWVDGDASGEIGVSDITPIANNYLNSVVEYSIRTANSPTGTFNEIGRATLADAKTAIQPDNYPIIFDISLPAGALDYITVVPLDSNEQTGISSSICAVANDVPPVINSVDPLSGSEGTEVYFTAQITGTSPINVDWDFGGGANPNTDTGNPSQYVILGAAGTYNAHVTATNSFGTDTFDFTITVNETVNVPVIQGVNPPAGIQGVQATFVPSITGSQPMTYAWDFGSGATPSTSTDENPIVTLGTIGNYAASLTITNEAGSDTYDFYYASVSTEKAAMERLFFLHHSTGWGFISEGNIRGMVALYNTDHSTNFEFWDHGYNGDGLTDPDGNQTGTNYGIPNDNTDPEGLHYLWTSQETDAVTARNLILDNYDVIAFKSCFPASAIGDDAQLEQYKSWYRDIRDFALAHPSHLFIFMSTPPLHRLSTNSDEATRARAFANWFGTTDFYSGSTKNILYYNLFDRLANPDDGSATANMLKYDYEGSHDDGDSHPNADANVVIGSSLPNFMCSWSEWYSDKFATGS